MPKGSRRGRGRSSSLSTRLATVRSYPGLGSLAMTGVIR